jgi:ABC-type amino acid transport substrate-binding protein
MRMRGSLLVATTNRASSSSTSSFHLLLLQLVMTMAFLHRGGGGVDAQGGVVSPAYVPLLDVEIPPPQLNGAHFKVTAIAQPGFVEYHENDSDGTIHHLGYMVDVFSRIAAPERGNFTYDIVSPSGYGSMCYNTPEERRAALADVQNFVPYAKEFRVGYACGQSDVTDLPPTNYTTDMYLGLYYINPERLLLNHFTQAIDPPRTGVLTMYGTATNVKDLDDLIAQQAAGRIGPVCIQENTAYSKFLRLNFPTLKVLELNGADEIQFQALVDGKCNVLINSNPVATHFILTRFANNQCHVDGKVRVDGMLLLLLLFPCVGLVLRGSFRLFGFRGANSLPLAWHGSLLSAFGSMIECPTCPTPPKIQHTTLHNETTTNKQIAHWYCWRTIEFWIESNCDWYSKGYSHSCRRYL